MEFEDQSDKPAPTCKHPNFLYTLKLIRIDKPELYIDQIVARVNVYCKDCSAPCTFKGNQEFSIENPTISNNDTFLIAPVILPPILSEIVENTDEENKTIH
jgi:hypothetical protein